MPEPRLRNHPPEHGILVPSEHQRQVISRLLATTPLRPADADFLAECLLENDRRCAYSHGSRQLPRYVRVLNEGRVNPTPAVRVISESGATAVVDGDGGMGHMACGAAIETLLEKVTAHGVAACTTGNHFHIGAAGTWTRDVANHGYIGMVMAASAREIDADNSITSLIDSSPISLGFPAGGQPPLILDMGGRMLPDREALLQEIPRHFFKALGLSTVIQVLGGVLSGAYRQRRPSAGPWLGDHGAFLCAWDVACFMAPSAFTDELDRFVSAARNMQPFPGTDRAELAGGMEWRWAQESLRRGIRLGDEHREMLEALAGEVGVECGYAEFDGSRF